MDCRQVRKNLVKIAEDEISRESQKAVHRHLQSCQLCAVLVERFQDLWRAWEDPVRVDPSPLFQKKLEQKIRASEESKISAVSSHTGRRRWLRPLAAAASIMIGIFAGYYLGNFPAAQGDSASEQSNALSTRFTDERLGYFDDFPAGSLAESYLSLGRENGEAGL